MNRVRMGRPRDVSLFRRNAEILALRESGLSYRLIAVKMKTTTGVVLGVCTRDAKARGQQKLPIGADIKRTVCMPRDLYERVKAHAHQTRSSFSEFCRDAVRREIERAA